MERLLFGYDIETYPNFFCMCLIRVDTGEVWLFEVSERRNDMAQLAAMIYWLRSVNARMVGFNSVGFDYPVIHFGYEMAQCVTAEDLYNKAMSIINAPREAKFSHLIWERDRYVDQVDCYKYMHFDNPARSTGLKVLEFNMRSDNIEDLPFAPGTVLNWDQMDIVLKYNVHDVKETIKFFNHTRDNLAFRDELSAKYNKDFSNHSDAKIGEDYLVMRLEEACPGICYTKSNGRRKPRGTYRSAGVALNEVIFPYVKFEHPEFNRILNWMRHQVITETKDVFKGVTAEINGFGFDFGTGGIHGSHRNAIYESSDTHVIIDDDVTSYYPSLGIVNRIYPEHLGELFCDIYADIKSQRVSYAKGTPENAMLKIALNGTYGKSNSIYSPFYDPKYTMAITMNGQLLLCMLSEQLMKVPGLEIIQINTDGVTYRVRRDMVQYTEAIRQWWMQVTGLELEQAEYSRMMIRDVNNYIAEYEDGKTKLKGAYEIERPWHKNHSFLIIPKAARAALVDGVPIEPFIRSHTDIYDFLGRTKVPRSSRLEWGDKQLQNVTRYYISTDGEGLTKIMPPTAKKPDVERRIGIDVGWLTTPCNDISYARWDNINFEYYIKEAEKLVNPLKVVQHG